MKIKLIDRLDVANTLGECVLYDHRNDVVLWTDIENCHLYSYNCTTKKLARFDTPQRLCAFALTTDSQILLCAFDTGFALYNYSNATLQWLYKPKELQSGNGLRLNDGRLDHKGRFWCGAMVEDAKLCPPNKASLYCLDVDGSLSKKFDNIDIANGICWNKSEKRMHFADSAKQKMYIYDYDAVTGNIHNKKLFVKTASDHFPDGAIIDSNNNLWSANWGSGRVVCYDKFGNIVTEVATTDAIQPSCVAFGGQSMTKLFVTTARQGLSAEQLKKYPCSGKLFIFEIDIQGNYEYVFNLNNYGK